MKRQTRYAALTTLSLLALAGAVMSQDAQAKIAGAEKAEIETIIRDYIMNNPTVILEAVEKHQRDQQAAMEQQQASNLKNFESYLYGPDLPSVGPKDADLIVVEFFDYNCGYCKKALPDIQAILKADPKLRVALVDLPVLGPSSELAAKWALAAHKQDKYFEYHVALMEFNGPKTEEVLEKLAKDVGLDVPKLKTDAQDPAVAEKLATASNIAQQLGINGTPGFIIGGEIVRGYLGEEGMLEAVKQTRAAKSGSTPAKE